MSRRNTFKTLDSIDELEVQLLQEELADKPRSSATRKRGAPAVSNKQKQTKTKGPTLEDDEAELLALAEQCDADGMRTHRPEPVDDDQREDGQHGGMDWEQQHSQGDLPAAGPATRNRAPVRPARRCERACAWQRSSGAERKENQAPASAACTATRHRRTFGSCINIANAQRDLHLHITTQLSTLSSSVNMPRTYAPTPYGKMNETSAPLH
jgi:hypothetical protein